MKENKTEQLKSHVHYISLIKLLKSGEKKKDWPIDNITWRQNKKLAVLLMPIILKLPNISIIIITRANSI